MIRRGRRSLAGLVLVAGLIAAACGAAVTETDPETGAGTGTATAQETSGVDEARLAAAEEVVRGMAGPNAGFAPPAVEVGTGNTGDRTRFLPNDATVTAFGDPILRTAAEPRGFGFGWGIDWNTRIIELDELTGGGPPRDGIPAIDHPKFISVAEADATYSDTSPVVQFELNGDVRAYPLAILTWHEIVNDVVGGAPVAVTFCPLCNTAIAFDRRLGDLTLDFGTSGLVRRSDLVMYDRTTESLWQQISGKALVGDMVGAKLTPLPAQIVSWAQFKANFPDGIVLSTDTGFSRDYGRNPYTGYDDVNNRPFLFRGVLDARLSPFERVVTLELGDEILAYPFVLLEQVGGVFADRRGGVDLVIFWAPGTSSALDTRAIDEGRDVGSAGVFRRELNGERLSFRPNPDDEAQATFLDEGTGSVWNLFGEAVTGPLTGARLEPLVHANHFWFAWAAFQPDTVIVTG